MRCHPKLFHYNLFCRLHSNHAHRNSLDSILFYCGYNVSQHGASAMAPSPHLAASRASAHVYTERAPRHRNRLDRLSNRIPRISTLHMARAGLAMLGLA